MNLGSIVGTVVVFGLLIWLLIKLPGWKRKLDEKIRILLGYVQAAIVLIIVISGIIMLGYFGVIKVPDVLRGPVAGNELPYSAPRDEPRTVAPPTPIAPLQPSVEDAAARHREQLRQLEGRPR